MRIAAYCRVSTDSEQQLDSLENQKAFFTEYAQKNGHELAALYADRGTSGTSLRRRTEFQRLMRDAERGLFEMVVVKDISRFARNTVDFLQSIRRLKALKIDTLFLTANMKSLGESEFVLTVFSAMAQEESANLSKRVRFGKKVNAKKGRVPQCIFGYDRLDNFTLAVNPEEAETVREIYRLYLEEGLGSWSVAGRLNAEGRLTKYRQEWDSRGVRRILENPLYCGVLVNHKYEVEDYLTGRSVRLPEGENFVHERPEWAVVTREQFGRVQCELARRRKGERQSADSRHSGKHLFSTLIKCESCGRSFTRKRYTYANTRIFWKCSTNESYPSERCGNRVTVDEGELLQALREWARRLAGDWEGFVQSIVAEARRQLPEQQVFDPDAGGGKRKRLESKKRRWQEMYANDLISLDELKARIGAIQRELEELERENIAVMAQGSAKDEETVCRERVEDFLSFKTMKNAGLRKIVDYISVDQDGNVRVYLCKA